MSALRNQSSAVLDAPDLYDADAFRTGVPPIHDQPYYAELGVELWLGDNRQVLQIIPEKSVQAVSTSPPYYGLRQYDGAPTIWGVTDPSCIHEWDEPTVIAIHDNYNEDFNERWGQGSGQRKQEKGKPKTLDQGRFCIHCNCWLGRLGNEPYPQLYIDNLVEIFDGVHRVLRNDGTIWVVIGDSYAGSGRGPSGESGIGGHDKRQGFADASASARSRKWRDHPGWWGLPDKSLMMIPARFAIEMQKRGWVLRNDAIWDKPNVIPASVTDRLTVNHEYIWLFSKQPTKYYFDIEAIKEPIADASKARYQQNIERQQGSGRAHLFGQGHDGPLKAVGGHSDLRQKRTVWRISTRSPDVSKKHTATFPPKIVEPMMLASTSEAGACPKCGSPFKRMMFKMTKSADEARKRKRSAALAAQRQEATGNALSGGVGMSTLGHSASVGQVITYGWKPSCRCGCQIKTDGKVCGKPWRVLTPAPVELVYDERKNKHRKIIMGPSTEHFACGHEAMTVPCRMLDLFGGSGTLIAVARQRNRYGIYIDVAKTYIEEAVKRAERTQPGLGLF